MRHGMAMMMAAAVLVGGCGDKKAADEPKTADAPATAIPASLAPFGAGYPAAGDACRRLGESPATSNWLDDSAVLAGCPDDASANALGGTIVATVEGVRIVSVPMPTARPAPAADEGDDALVSGTDYNATSEIPCSADGSTPSGSCKAGVKRNRGDDATTFVEITKADGMPRTIFFKDGKAFGADSAQADGSAAYDFKATRSGDNTNISFGPERYVVPDALVVGG